MQVKEQTEYTADRFGKCSEPVEGNTHVVWTVSLIYSNGKIFPQVGTREERGVYVL